MTRSVTPLVPTVATRHATSLRTTENHTDERLLVGKDCPFSRKSNRQGNSESNSGGDSSGNRESNGQSDSESNAVSNSDNNSQSDG